jgi:hypothetical protein
VLLYCSSHLVFQMMPKIPFYPNPHVFESHVISGLCWAVQISQWNESLCHKKHISDASRQSLVTRKTRVTYITSVMWTNH